MSKLNCPSLFPNAKLGVLGGGQLGRMFAIAARAMGYWVLVFDPDKSSPAKSIADEHLCAAFNDESAWELLIKSCDAVTVEFENIPMSILEFIHDKLPFSPGIFPLAVAQNRIEEKQFLNRTGLETVNFHILNTVADIQSAFTCLTPPLIFKTARLGYDGKGQQEVDTQEQAVAAFTAVDACPSILEEKAELMCELSVMVVRDREGNSVCYPVAENEHQDGILHISIIPARVDAQLIKAVQTQAKQIAERLDYQGVLGVEFFITTDGRVLVNEIAPRPHNSGHYTIDACAHSQFTQQVRMMCGLTPAATTLFSPVVMVNILGDAWDGKVSPNWDYILSNPDANLHLYGKKQAHKGRKMGHFCLLGKEIDSLVEQAETIHQQLMRQHG